MLEDSQTRLHQLFEQAVDLPPTGRARLLDEQCGADSALRAQLEKLLEWDAAAGDEFLECSGITAEHEAALASEAPGSEIGRYTLIEQAGEGGMAVVWVARQNKPVKRNVALKILKPGMDSKQVLARFELERNVLAMFNHAHIARVFDAGMTAQGRPYFAMELVEGAPVTRFCDDHRLTTSQRLRLFIDVCEAVQHAHQKGIIHRDIKPGNILVTMQDDKPLPKVIDFGIAKAMAGELTRRTVFTEQGQLIGTPEYMSPEQAQMSDLGIDTTTDIYSLGVLLYELLTGLLPFDPLELRAKGPSEIQRTIEKVEPARPSTRLSSLSAQRQSPPPSPPGRGVGGEGSSQPQRTHHEIADQRHTDPRTLVRELRGDLDWIVMKAMDKQRSRRYASASELAADIRRHLRHEPVLAGPPTAAYRLRKFVARNKVGVAFAATIAILTTAGFATSLTFWLQASQEREEALKQAQIAEAVSQFLNEDILAVSNPMRKQAWRRGEGAATAGTDDPRLSDVLRRAAERIEGKFPDQPLVEAEIRVTIGRFLRSQQRMDQAAVHLKRAWELRERELGPDHESTWGAAMLYAPTQVWFSRPGSVELVTELWERRRRQFGLNDIMTTSLQFSLAVSHRRHGRLIEAERLLREILTAEGRIEKVPVLDHLGSTLYSRAENARDAGAPLANEAALMREAGEIRIASVERAELEGGQLGPNMFICKNHEAETHEARGEWAKALLLRRDLYRTSLDAFGDRSGETRKARYRLADHYVGSGDFEEGIELYQRDLDLTQEAYGREHDVTAAAFQRLGYGYEAQGAYAQAQRAYEEALDILRSTSADGQRVARCLNDLANCLCLAGKPDEAEPLAREALKVQEQFAADNPFKQERIPRRVHMRERARTLCDLLNTLAVSLRDQGRTDEAYEVYQRLYKVWNDVHEDVPPYDRGFMVDYGVCLAQMQRLGEAEQHLRDCVRRHQDYLDRGEIPGRNPLGGVRTSLLKANAALTDIYVTQARFDEAEPFAIEAYEGRVELVGETHAFTRDSLQQLVDLYDQWDEPDQAAQWRAKLAPSSNGDGS